jgi:c-di-GMP-binding flagellar brake protein YcgR
MGVAWYNSRSPSRAADWVQRRKSARRQINIVAAILPENGGPMIAQCTMADISAGGARLIVEDAATIPDTFLLVLSRAARTHRKCSVRWRAATAIGVEFAQS